MNTIVVLDDPKRWPFDLPGVDVVSAKRYLVEPAFGERRSTRLYNLCQSYRYQRTGYYVSLLAEARGHRPMPSTSVMQDLRSSWVPRFEAGGLDAALQKSLREIRGDSFTLSVYFGRNLAARHAALARRLFELFPAPLLRARFARQSDQWQLVAVDVIPIRDVPETHHAFLADAARRFFEGGVARTRRSARPRFDIAILTDPDETHPPSDARALRRFHRAAERAGLLATSITRNDFGRLGEFDALFIRETTRVNHHTFRFAQRAAAEGLVVIDDPRSIVRCTNKVYLAELLQRHRIRGPRTLVVHKGNADEVADAVGLPCVLKAPDSAFSLGVVKASTREELGEATDRLLKESDLIVAQEFLPTDFDWRIGVLDRKPLYACKYFMARRHWQIIQHAGDAQHEGAVETLAIDDAPRPVVRAALRVANRVGDGLYGVDLKQIGSRVYVMEINDNPSIDAGYEDRILRDDLYDAVMQSFVRRIEAMKEGK